MNGIQKQVGQEWSWFGWKFKNGSLAVGLPLLDPNLQPGPNSVACDRILGNLSMGRSSGVEFQTFYLVKTQIKFISVNGFYSIVHRLFHISMSLFFGNSFFFFLLCLFNNRRHSEPHKFSYCESEHFSWQNDPKTKLCLVQK